MTTHNYRIKNLFLWLTVAGIWFLIDRFSKTMIVHYYSYGDSTPIFSFFNIVRVHNKGAAFSFLASGSGWQLWFLSTIAILVSGCIIYLLYKHGTQWLFCISLSGILAGALGNSADRALYGYVVDFLDFHINNWHYPAFNAADIFICLGVFGIILDEIVRVRSSKD